MSSEPNPPAAPGNYALRKLIWLFVALVPSAVGLLCLTNGTSLEAHKHALMSLNLALSFCGSIGLVWREENLWGVFIFGLFLTGFFFVLNAVVVVFAGCSGIGSIH